MPKSKWRHAEKNPKNHPKPALHNNLYKQVKKERFYCILAKLYIKKVTNKVFKIFFATLLLLKNSWNTEA